MSIYFENETDMILPEEQRGWIEKAVTESLRYEGCPEDLEVSVLITDEAAVRELNRKHRGIDKATDVLSFPLLPPFTAVTAAPGQCLGDIVICLPVALRQAEAYGHSPLRELGFLCVHSMLHLIGYDHMNPAEEALMFAKQEAVLQSIGLIR